MLMLTVEVMRVPGAPDEAILLRVTLDKESKEEKPSYQSGRSGMESGVG